MKNTIVAIRYAKSLLDLAIELKSLEVVLADMKLIYSVCSANPELMVVLRSPIIKSDKKAEYFDRDIWQTNLSFDSKILELVESKKA